MFATLIAKTKPAAAARSGVLQSRHSHAAIRPAHAQDRNLWQRGGEALPELASGEAGRFSDQMPFRDAGQGWDFTMIPVFQPERQSSFSSPHLQRKLAIGSVNDPLEQEADRIADAVTAGLRPGLEWSFSRMSIDAPLQRKCACGALAGAGGKCEKCKKKEKVLQLASLSPHGRETESEGEVPPVVHEVLRSPGEPLDANTRAFMESRFGHDFSQVRVHTDAKAAESARSVGARAYTVGRNIAFAAGEYALKTNSGWRLLAHELAHTVQQVTDRPGLKLPGARLQRQDNGNGDIAEPAPTGAKAACTPQHDATYGPNSSNCSAYQSGLAKRFLTWTYRHNATCACENTPDNPKNNCVRKCLQARMATFLSRLSKGGAAIGTCLDPIGILDFSCPEPFCKDLYNHHVDCYRECCCEKDFIGYPWFWFMCEAPYPCVFVSFTIDKFNRCT